VAPPSQFDLDQPNAEPDAGPDAAPPAPPIPIATSDDLAEARKLLPPPSFKRRADGRISTCKATPKLYSKKSPNPSARLRLRRRLQAGSSIHFRMADSDYRDALHGLEAATGSFLVPLSKRVFLVVKDTTQKRTEREPTAAIELHLPKPPTRRISTPSSPPCSRPSPSRRSPSTPRTIA